MGRIVSAYLFALSLTSCQFMNVNTYYHEPYGIPNAARIKNFENALFLDGSTADYNDTADFRIIGGQVAPPNAFPYLGGLIITLVNSPGVSVCGSSLISDTRLVTAAHCANDGEQVAAEFEVVLGSQYLYYGGDRYRTSNVVTHPNWFPPTLLYDLAILFLDQGVYTSEFVWPVNLPYNYLGNSFYGEWATAIGYGLTSDQQLYVDDGSTVSYVSLRVISDEECQQVYLQTTGTICTDGTGPVGICNGDSGGPLVINLDGQDTLIGITSFKFLEGCELGYPSGFTRVTYYYDYIMQNM